MARCAGKRIAYAAATCARAFDSLRGVGNAYTSNHGVLQQPGIGTGRRVALHVIDTVCLVHAILLRIQVLLLPFKALVLGGGH